MNEEQQQEYQWLQIIVFYLQLDPARWPFKDLISRPAALAAVTQWAGLKLDPNDPDFLPQVAQKIAQFLDQAETIVAPNVPIDIADKVAQLDDHLAEEKARGERILLRTKEAKELYGRYQQAIQKELEANEPVLAQNKQLAETVTKEAVTELIAELPPTATETAFEISVPEEEYQKSVAQVLKNQLKKAGLKPPQPTVIEKVATQSRPAAAAIAADRQTITIPLKETIRPTKEPLAKLAPLPSAVAEKLAAQVEGTAFRPSIFKPPRPVVTVLKAAADNLTDEWQIMIKQGIFVEDLQASMKALKEAGLADDHSIMERLKIKAKELKAVQKIILPNGQEADHPLVKRLKNSYQLNKKLGRWQEKLSEIQIHLPRSSPSQIDNPWQRLLKRIGKAAGFYRQRSLGLGKTVLQPVIRPFFRNALSRIAIAFKKTKFGQALVGGFKNTATRIAVRLGAKEAAKKAVGAVAKAAKFSVTKLISKGLIKIGLAVSPEAISKALLIVSTLKDIVWGAIKGFFRRIKGFFADFLPRQAKYATRTASDQITNSLALAGAVVGGFLVVLATTTLIASGPLALLIAGPIALTGILAQLNNQIVSSAFVQPGRGGEILEFVGDCLPVQLPEEAGHLAENVIYTLDQCDIEQVTPTTLEATKNCLLDSDLPGKQVLFNQFEFSVNEVGPALQCVGFVRGVMSALGIDPGSGRHARQFLDPPPPAGYSINTNLSLVQVGDLVVMKGSTYGHIAIVTGRDGPRIRVAQAFGESGGFCSTELNITYFDGFLRANTP